MNHVIDSPAATNLRKSVKILLSSKSVPLTEQSSPSNSRAFSTTRKQSFNKSQDSKLFYSQSKSSFSSEKWDYFFKVVLVGPPRSGKTSILRQYCNNEFHKSYHATFGINNQLKTVVIGDYIIKLSLWDIPSGSKFAGRVESQISSADAILFVYDTSDEASASEVATMVSELMTGMESEALLFAVANKIDEIINNSPHVPIPKEIAATFKLGLANTSARSRKQTEKLFEQIIKGLIEKRIRSNEVTSMNNSSFDSNSLLSESEASNSFDVVDDKEERRYLKSKFQSKFAFLKNEAQPSYNLKCPLTTPMKGGNIQTSPISKPRLHRVDSKVKRVRILLENEHNVPLEKLTIKRFPFQKSCC